VPVPVWARRSAVAENHRMPLIEPVVRPNIRLIAADMDGTLLDDDGELHDHFWPLIDELHRRGVLFCPASGRQYQKLLERFADVADEVVFVAENGTYVVHQGQEISSDCLSLGEARLIIDRVRDAVAGGVDAGAVLCGKRGAYIDRVDERFTEAVGGFFARLEQVPDMLAVVDDDVLKVSIYDFGSAESGIAPLVADFVASHNVTVSSEHWVDITSATANKGAAIEALQRAYGISPAQTMVFGDFLNDLQMMDTAEWSFAMGNAHPLLKARARYLAPTNTENGVVRTISALMGLDWH
jgi:Cof subfamily protein (haloacid dehalogenase superfamily)